MGWGRGLAAVGVVVLSPALAVASGLLGSCWLLTVPMVGDGPYNPLVFGPRLCRILAPPLSLFLLISSLFRGAEGRLREGRRDLED